MGLSVYKVVHVTCQSRRWFVKKETNYTNESNANFFVNAKNHSKEKPLLAG